LAIGSTSLESDIARNEPLFKVSRRVGSRKRQFRTVGDEAFALG
jgi:hypothetical protein